MARVRLDAEQQRHVHVDPAGDRLLDRRHALVGAGDLDHQVGAVDALPEVARLRERGVGVVREAGLDLERHEAVGAAGLVPDRAQDVAGELDVGDRDLLVDLLRVEALAGQLADLLVVVVRAEDRLLEDRRVRGHAAQRVLAHQPLELAAGDQAAPDLVEPDARAGRGQRREPLVDLRSDAHAVAPSRSSDRPSAGGHVLGREAEVLVQAGCGAEAPNAVMPTWSPSSVVQRAQPKRGGRLHRHARPHARRQHAVAVVVVLLGEALQAGRGHHPRGDPLRLQQVGRLGADVHLRAGADQDQVGVALLERVAQHVGAAVDRVVRHAARVPDRQALAAEREGHRRGRLLDREAPGQRGLVGPRRAHHVQVRAWRAGGRAARSAGASARPRRDRSSRA